MSERGLHVAGLSAGYGARHVLDGLDLPPVAPGNVVSLIGPNGAGKSTLLRALAGLLPAAGSVRLEGEALDAMTLAERARRVTYMPQSLPQGVALSVLETAIEALRASPVSGRVAGREDAVARAMDVLERIGIAHLALEGLDRLSGGQRQLAGLAQALVREPRLLLLDEPTSALDLHYQVKLLDLVREIAAERGAIAILVLHDLQAAIRVSDRIVVMEGGTVAAAGTPEEALNPDLLARVYKVRARAERCARGTLRIMVDDVI